MNDIIQNLEANATNGKENFCYISEKQLNAMKELSKREAKENKQLKEIYKELFNTYQKLKKENEEVTSLNLHQVDKIQQLQKELEEYEQLKDNWNKLKQKMIDSFNESQDVQFLDVLQDMQELEQGSDNK